MNANSKLSPIFSQRWYAYGPGPNAVLNQINVASPSRQTMIPDIQGSFMGSLDSSSGTLTKAGYLPYGGSASTSGTFRYTGQRIDPESGLYYYRSRMYCTAWGRFCQPDTIGYAGGVNLYAYVGNDPLNKVDPSGLDALVIVGGERTDSWNFFGHVSIAVTGGGIYSFGTGTPLGSSVSSFVNSQSAARAQTMYTITTTPQQDTQMLSFLQGQTDNIGLWDNCAARTCEALNAGGVLDSIATAHTPEAVADQLIGSGANFTTSNFNVQTSIPQSVAQQFEVPQPASQQPQSSGSDGTTLVPGGALQSPSFGSSSQSSPSK